MLDDIQTLLPLPGTAISERPTIEAFAASGVDLAGELKPVEGIFFKNPLVRKSAGTSGGCSTRASGLSSNWAPS